MATNCLLNKRLQSQPGFAREINLWYVRRLKCFNINYDSKCVLLALVKSLPSIALKSSTTHPNPLSSPPLTTNTQNEDLLN